MRRKFLFSFPVFQIALYLCLAVLSAAGQTIDIQQTLIGEWRGPDTSFNGKYPLTVVFAYEGDIFKAFISRNMNLHENRRFPFYSMDALRMSGRGWNFALKGITPTAAFYEGEFSPKDETLTLYFSYRLPSEPEKKITWKLKKAPLCHEPEEMSAAARDLWEGRRVADVQNTLPGCFPVELYEDQLALLHGLVILRGGDFAFNRRGNYRTDDRYDDALRLFNKALSLNRQNPLALYASAYIYYEKALLETKRLNSLVEYNGTDFVYRRLSAQQIELEKEKSRRLSIKLLDDGIACYTEIISINAFETDAYIKRARTFYTKWSKYEPDTEYLKSALKDYKAAIELNPLSYELFYERAMIYSYLGDKENSEADLMRSAELKINK